MGGERSVVWVLVAFYALILAIAVWSMASPGMCAAPPFTFAIAAGQATWCFEFWLNRYQTLIAALIAGLVAIFTGIFVYRQWRETRAQAAFYRRSILREDASRLATLILEAKDMRREAENLFDDLRSLLGDSVHFDQSRWGVATDRWRRLENAQDEFRRKLELDTPSRLSDRAFDFSYVLDPPLPLL